MSELQRRSNYEQVEEFAKALSRDWYADAGAVPIATAEDILVAKLDWYTAGGEVYERQWSDILGILAANSGLDLTYARTWAARLRVDHLLDRALDSTR